MTVEDLDLSHNGQTGVYLLSGVVTGCTVSNNGATGISVNYEARVTGNWVTYNGIGIQIGYGLINGNTVVNNRLLGAGLISRGGYWGNAFVDNNGGGAQVSGGVNLGQNLCGTVVCP